METFISFVEYILCYHAWCHYSCNLPREMQEDKELISFSTRMVVQYFDTIIYRGDNTVDSGTCKIHSQMHNMNFFGDLMQYNMETGERGLKIWAKSVLRMAVKHGHDKFTRSTANHVGDRLLLNAYAD